MASTGLMRNSFLGLPLLVFLFFSCGKKEKLVDNKTPVNSEVKAPPFKADSAYKYIQDQVNFGPRFPNSPGHQKCGDYLASKLKSFNAEVVEQRFEAEAFNGKKLQLRNIIGSFKPNNPKRILLLAHYDTRAFAEKDSLNKKDPILGANDGGSGVGVLLEIAYLLSKDPNYNVGVDIIFFDGEDYGDTVANSKETWCLGSQYWAKNKHTPDYSAYYGILLDMVGAKEAKFSKEHYSLRYARQIVNNVWETGQKLGYSNYFLDFEHPNPITDDHRYINEIAKIPTIDIIDIDPVNLFGYYHHTHKDNMDVIDKNTLKAVGETVLHVLYNEPGQEVL